jgi:hypothetical protein
MPLYSYQYTNPSLFDQKEGGPIVIPQWLASPTKDDELLFLVAENWNDSDEGFDSGFDNGFG